MGRSISIGILSLMAVLGCFMVILDPVADWKRLKARSPIDLLRLTTESDLSGQLPLIYSRLRHHASNYSYLIEKDQLLDGMVANRSLYGGPTSICDSLLFSSLRYVALRKLGHDKKALKAWQAIEKSQYRGQWFRHPSCATQSTSRDMIVGLLAALSQKPPHYRLHLERLIETIRLKKGYIGTGRFYVSLLTPGLAEIIRLMAIDAGMDEKELPAVIRRGFSTLEVDSVLLQRGFTSHLNALVLWLELEILSRRDGRHEGQSVRTIFDFTSELGLSSTDRFSDEQRRRWIAFRLAKLDPQNLFFRWLLLNVTNELDARRQAALAQSLLSMPQFPLHRLPANCDRKADYLWQRDSHEYAPQTSDCSHFYSGVDFLWMSSLLISSDAVHKDNTNH